MVVVVAVVAVVAAAEAVEAVALEVTVVVPWMVCPDRILRATRATRTLRYDLCQRPGYRDLAWARTLSVDSWVCSWNSACAMATCPRHWQVRKTGDCRVVRLAWD